MRSGFFSSVARKVTLALLTLAGSACKQPLEQTFSLSTDAPSRTGLVAFDGGFAIGNDVGAVWRIDPDGAVRWRTTLGGAVVARPAVAGDVLVAATLRGDWVGLRVDDGRELWRNSEREEVRAGLTSDGPRVFGVDQGGNAWALAAETGAIDWKHGPEGKLSKEPRFPAPVFWDGAFVAALGDGGLVAWSANDGALRWRAGARGVIGLLPQGSQLIALGASGRVVAYRPDGSQAWSRELGIPAAGGPSAAQGLIWIGLEDRTLIGLAPGDGAERERFALPARAIAPVASFGDLILVPTSGNEGRLLALRLGHGAPAFELRVDSPLRSEPRIANDQVLLAPADGRVLGFRPRAESSRR